MKKKNKLTKYSRNLNQVVPPGSYIAHPNIGESEEAIGNCNGTYNSSFQLVDLRHSLIVWFGPVLILVFALFPWPYGYYVFLRISISCICAWLAYNQWRHDDAISSWVFIFAGVGILYNPILPIHLTREIWTILNIITAGLFIGHYFMLKKLLFFNEANPSEPSNVTEDAPSRKLNSTIPKQLGK